MLITRIAQIREEHISVHYARSRIDLREETAGNTASTICKESGSSISFAAELISTIYFLTLIAWQFFFAQLNTKFTNCCIHAKASGHDLLNKNNNFLFTNC